MIARMSSPRAVVFLAIGVAAVVLTCLAMGIVRPSVLTAAAQRFLDAARNAGAAGFAGVRRPAIDRRCERYSAGFGARHRCRDRVWIAARVSARRSRHDGRRFAVVRPQPLIVSQRRCAPIGAPTRARPVRRVVGARRLAHRLSPADIPGHAVRRDELRARHVGGRDRGLCARHRRLTARLARVCVHWHFARGRSVSVDDGRSPFAIGHFGLRRVRDRGLDADSWPLGATRPRSDQTGKEQPRLDVKGTASEPVSSSFGPK